VTGNVSVTCRYFGITRDLHDGGVVERSEGAPPPSSTRRACDFGLLGSYWANPATRSFGELVIDCEEDRTLRRRRRGE